MKFEFSWKTWTDFCKRLLIMLLLGWSITFGVIGAFYWFQPAEYWVGYDNLRIPESQRQGAPTYGYPSFYVKRAYETITYVNQMICEYPTGEIDRTSQQISEFRYDQRFYAGYPFLKEGQVQMMPKGFKASEKRDGINRYAYEWKVQDVPPPGSRCVLQATAYVEPFFGWFRKTTAPITSNVTVMRDSNWIEVPKRYRNE